VPVAVRNTQEEKKCDLSKSSVSCYSATVDDASNNKNLTQLFIGNLSWNAKSKELIDLFSKYGLVENATISMNPVTGRSNGFGFVTIDSNSADRACMALNGTDFMGRKIEILKVNTSCANINNGHAARTDLFQAPR
jgi:RNA recognition motif-containing protein